MRSMTAMAYSISIVSLVCVFGARGIASSGLTLTPTLGVMEVNFPSNFSCQATSPELQAAIANHSAVFEWGLDGGKTLYPGQSLNGRILAVSDNTNQTTLMVLKAHQNDTGAIECRLRMNSTAALLANATAHFQVYVLSSYFAEGMIVLAANCVLFVIFLACSVRQCCAGRRKDDAFRKYNGHLDSSHPGQQNDGDHSNLMERGQGHVTS